MSGRTSSQAVSRSVLMTTYVTFEPPGEAGEGLVQLYVIKPQGGLDHDVCGLGFSNNGNVPTHVIVRTCEYY